MMAKRKNAKDDKVTEVCSWFAAEVTYDGEPYIIDEEQAAAVLDEGMNTIVVARAGSGKTRTIVAKIIYMVAKRGIKPQEIMAFVFNSNAAVEINARLQKMRVGGVAVIPESVRIARTFHAFARKVVLATHSVRGLGGILAGDRELYTRKIVDKMMKEPKWRSKILWFIGRSLVEDVGTEKNRGGVEVTEEELARFSRMMMLFINRAQQKYLGGKDNLKDSVRQYLANDSVVARNKVFVEVGNECYKRYHWYLLDKAARMRWLTEMEMQATLGEYSTDFNLLMSWAGRLIRGGRPEVRSLVGGVKYLLIDEYQDFSQLFLYVVMALREIVGDARVFVVGDDWQAINRFAGSDVEYFKEFEKFFPEGNRRLEISTNYRCDYEIVDAARKFMQKSMGEKGDFRANSKKAGRVVLVEPTKVEVQYGLVEYDARVSKWDKVYADAARRMAGRMPKKSTVQYIKSIIQIIGKNTKVKEILILHRNNETYIEGVTLRRMGLGLKWALEKLGVMSGEEFESKVRIMTMHKSKGLEAEVVIILEADAGVIPKTHPDTKLYEIFGETEDAALDDQKRLFYVAMTRAKKRLYIMHEKTAGGDDGFVRYLGRGIERWEG